MGFYGNITNTTRTQFSFDAVYSSRYEMDTATADDHVYIGRYVLIEYDTKNGGLDKFQAVYKVVDKRLTSGYVFCISNELKIPSSGNTGTVIQLRKEGSSQNDKISVDKGTIIRIPGSNDKDNVQYNQTYEAGKVYPTEYWICTGETTGYIRVEVEGKVTTEPFPMATWENIGLSSSTNFSLNYNQDKLYYGVSRGYDSTVWQKVLQDGYEKYVMVAELNTVVPTFDISADAPTQIPLMPHFDTNSTNVYYNLHWQPNWGFRVKTAHTLQTPQLSATGEVLSDTVSTSNDAVDYPSDETIVWQRDIFDNVTNSSKRTYARAIDQKINWVDAKYADSTTEGAKPELPAAIYYNKAGLAPDKVVKSWDKTYANQPAVNTAPRRSKDDPEVNFGENKNFISDEISIKPTGLSGQKYSNHNKTEQSFVDTQEISIMLPSIGDAISDVWDLVYGGRSTNAQIKDTHKRNMDIEWHDARSVQDRAGLRLVSDGFSYKKDVADKEGNVTQELMTYEKDSYNTANVNTIAGCINSVHDLMGMIIEPYSNRTAMIEKDKSNTDDIIYYEAAEKKFYRKGTSYKYTPATNIYTFEPISLFKTEYKPGLFYIKNPQNDSQTEYVESTGDYSDSTQYYVRKIENGGTYKHVSEIRDYTKDYNNGKYYYYKKPLGNSKYDYIVNPTYYNDKTYYTVDNAKVDATRQDLGTEFTTGKYYTLTNQVLTLDKQEYDAKKTYYDVKEIFSLADINSIPPYTDLYLPGIFYYKAWSRDAYKHFSYSNELKNETLYILEDVDTYTLVRDYDALQEGDTVYQKIHDKGDPYLETVQNKNDFEYLVDNTEHGAGCGRKDNKGNYIFTNLVNHFMVEAQSSEVEIYTPVITYEQVYFDKDSGYIYASGVYYIRNQRGEFEISYHDTPQSGIAYYEKQMTYVFTGQGGTINEKNPLNLYPYTKSEDIKYMDKNGKEQKFSKDLLPTHPWYLKEQVTTYDNNGNPIVNIKYTEVTSTSIRQQLIDYYTKGIGNRDKLQYFKIETSKIQRFYAPDTYYYKVGEKKDSVYKNSYILETNKKKVIPDSVSTDYALAHLLIDDNLFKEVEGTTFYYPNYYYYKDIDGEYVLGTEATMKEGFEYYIQDGVRYYVIEDTAGVIPYGQMWNPNIKNVPPSITLATRNVGYEYYEMPEFARKLNTIHGMILKVNQMLDEGNEGSRDMKTVQGALNSLKDWIAHLGTLDSQEILMVDSYGSIQTAPIICNNQVEKNVINFKEDVEYFINEQTKKSNEQDIASDIYPAVNSVGDKQWKNQWLTVNIDGKPTNPRITVRHNYQPVKNKKTSLNLNGEGDTFVLTTPIIDPRGHVVGKNDETITLPYGFKTIETNGRSDAVNENASSEPTKPNIVADNTQDSLTINSGNKWVRIDTNASDNSLTISHDVHNIDTTAQKDKTDLNNGTDIITIQDTEYDEAGHVKSNKSHQFILPYGFKTISTNGRASGNNKDNLDQQAQIVADNTQDTLSINSGDAWTKITTNADTDTLTISHDVKNTTSTDSTQDLSSETQVTSFDVTTYNFDEMNHFSSKDVKTITMPNGYGKIAADAGATTGASATYDTLTLSGDSWLKTAVSKDKVTFTHEAPLKTDNTTTNVQDNKNLSLGGTFTIPIVSYDAKGHISSNGTYTLTLPSLEIVGVKDTGDNVLVDLTYTKNGTAITRNYNKIGNLQLTGYAASTVGGDVASADTLNTAIGKLQFNITKEITDRGNAINNLEFKDIAVAGQYVDSVSEFKGIINVTRKEFNPQVSITDLDTTPKFNLEVGGIAAEINLPIASETEFGLIKTSDSYEAVEDEAVLEGLAASSKALRDLAQNSCLKDEAFTYNKTIREGSENTWTLTQEEIPLTIQELFNRVSLLEKTILNSNKYATIEEIESVEGGSVLE